MLPIPGIWLRVGAAAIVCAFIGFHIYGDNRVKRELEQTRHELAQTKAELELEHQKLMQVTRDRDEVSQKISEAEKQNEKIRAELNSSVTKIRQQKPPVDCAKLGKWLVDNKADLKW